MPGVARKGVDAAGGVAIGGSSDVFVNGSGIVREGDTVAGHGLPPHSPPPPMVGKSSTVRANGKFICRQGDSASCGHSISGSNNVFSN